MSDTMDALQSLRSGAHATKHKLFGRGTYPVCPSQPPPCPSCSSNEVCSFIPGNSDSCAVTKCTAIGAAATPSANPGPSPAGPIAGGVIGGIVVVCLMTFLVWRFCIKKRRQQFETAWRESRTTEKTGYEASMPKDVLGSGRASMHSVRSIASTVLTRASNVIQIAYIPGVTNRSVETAPDLIPPVPPIPAASPRSPTSTATTPLPGQDQHFFMPSDLRDSTYSDYTVDRDSYARTSTTPSMARGSVHSTAYRGSAVVNTIPAQTAIRGKANPVALKSSNKSSPVGSPRSITPPLPVMDRSRPAPLQERTAGPTVARIGFPKAVTVTRIPSINNNNNNHLALSATKKPTPTKPGDSEVPSIRLERHASNAKSRLNVDSSTFDDASSSDEDSPAEQSLMGHEKRPAFDKSSPKSPSPAPDLRRSRAMASSSVSSVSTDRSHLSSKETKQMHRRSGSLNQIIEEATRRASRDPRHGGLGSVGSAAGGKREFRGPNESPFSDANAARTP